ncbi:MAG: dihydropteroate synthase [Chloroflexi bacterium]|nr:dihydropteroate synthase [Chloroflexota bacterium]MDA1147302.1 dihydropteroate synthase [Chloroflexota bacterium]MQC82471.1 dihydropteroate synthase [Chloroflexota bacterium]
MELLLGEHTIDCTNRTAVMGILNVSDDSPIGQSIVPASSALDRAVELRRQGAEIVDIGAVSTATGSRELTAQEEIDRVCPAIEAVAAEGIATSVDTWNPEVARAAAAAGVHLLNDVSGFTKPEMVAVAGELGIACAVMHMRGQPAHHYEADQSYADITSEVEAFLLERAAALDAAGAGQVWLDPGFEFGKQLADNLALFGGLRSLVATGRPVLISASRKGFLAELLGHAKRQDVPGLLEATIAFNTLAAYEGVQVVRVHDVEPVAQALAVVNGLRAHLAEQGAG